MSRLQLEAGCQVSSQEVASVVTSYSHDPLRQRLQGMGCEIRATVVLLYCVLKFRMGQMPKLSLISSV